MRQFFKISLIFALCCTLNACSNGDGGSKRETQDPGITAPDPNVTPNEDVNTEATQENPFQSVSLKREGSTFTFVGSVNKDTSFELSGVISSDSPLTNSLVSQDQSLKADTYSMLQSNVVFIIYKGLGSDVSLLYVFADDQQVVNNIPTYNLLFGPVRIKTVTALDSIQQALLTLDNKGFNQFQALAHMRESFQLSSSWTFSNYIASLDSVIAPLVEDPADQTYVSGSNSNVKSEQLTQTAPALVVGDINPKVREPYIEEPHVNKPGQLVDDFRPFHKSQVTHQGSGSQNTAQPHVQPYNHPYVEDNSESEYDLVLAEIERVHSQAWRRRPPKSESGFHNWAQCTHPQVAWYWAKNNTKGSACYGWSNCTARKGQAINHSSKCCSPSTGAEYCEIWYIHRYSLQTDPPGSWTIRHNKRN